MNNCKCVSTQTIPFDDTLKLSQRSYECWNETRVGDAADAIHITPFTVTITSAADVDVQQSSNIQQTQSEQLPNFDNHFVQLTDNSTESRAGFVVPIDLSPLPTRKVLPGIGFGIGAGILSNSQITNTAATNTCNVIGKFPQNNNCTTYNVCWGFGRGQIGLICPQDLAFDRHLKHCSQNWSTCPLLARCTMNNQLIPDPSSRNNFFICVQNGFSLFATTYEKQFSVFRRRCMGTQMFNEMLQGCR